MYKAEEKITSKAKEKAKGQSGLEAFKEINQLLRFPEHSASLRFDMTAVSDDIEG